MILNGHLLMNFLVEFPEQAEIIRRLQPDFVPEDN